MCPLGGVRDGVVVHKNRGVVDVEVVAAAAHHDHRRNPKLQPKRAHAVDELFSGRGTNRKNQATSMHVRARTATSKGGGQVALALVNLLSPASAGSCGKK